MRYERLRTKQPDSSDMANGLEMSGSVFPAKKTGRQ
jgi:hypothetical protein